MCSCHFQNGDKTNEPRLAIAEECSVLKELCSSEITSANESCSQSLGDNRSQVSLSSESETNSILFEAVPITSTSIRNRINDPFDHSSVSENISELTTGTLLTEVSNITVSQDLFEAERSLWKKEKEALVLEKNRSLAKNLLLKEEIEKIVGLQTSVLEAKRCKWQREKMALMEENDRLLAENLLLKERIENLTDDGKLPPWNL